MGKMHIDVDVQDNYIRYADFGSRQKSNMAAFWALTTNTPAVYLDTEAKISGVDGDCEMCLGYGMWPDLTQAMGRLDAEDGMPTVACPMCGANANSPKAEDTRRRVSSVEEFADDIEKI